MSFIGVGGEDWVELDMDLFDRQRTSRLKTVLVDDADRIGAALGGTYEMEVDPVGQIFLVMADQRRYLAEMTRADRLIVTRVHDRLLDADSPL